MSDWQICWHFEQWMHFVPITLRKLHWFDSFILHILFVRILLQWNQLSWRMFVHRSRNRQSVLPLRSSMFVMHLVQIKMHQLQKHFLLPECHKWMFVWLWSWTFLSYCWFWFGLCSLHSTLQDLLKHDKFMSELPDWYSVSKYLSCQLSCQDLQQLAHLLRLSWELFKLFIFNRMYWLHSDTLPS